MKCFYGIFLLPFARDQPAFEGEGGSKGGFTLHKLACSATVSSSPLKTHFTPWKPLERPLKTALSSSCNDSIPSVWFFSVVFNDN